MRLTSGGSGDDRAIICGARPEGDNTRLCTRDPHTREEAQHLFEDQDRYARTRDPSVPWPAYYGGYLPSLPDDPQPSSQPPLRSGSDYEGRRLGHPGRLRRGQRAGAYTGPRGVDDVDDDSSSYTHDPEEVRRRRHKKPRSTPQPVGGTGMSSAGELSANFKGLIARIVERQGQLHDVITEMGSIQQQAAGATDGTGNEAALAGNDRLQEAVTACEDALQAMQAAIEQYQTYAAAL